MLRVLKHVRKLLWVTGAATFAYLALLFSTIGYDLDPAIAMNAGLLFGVQLACLVILRVIEWKEGGEKKVKDFDFLKLGRFARGEPEPIEEETGLSEVSRAIKELGARAFIPLFIALVLLVFMVTEQDAVSRKYCIKICELRGGELISYSPGYCHCSGVGSDSPFFWGSWACKGAGVNSSADSS